MGKRLFERVIFNDNCFLIIIDLPEGAGGSRGRSSTFRGRQRTWSIKGIVSETLLHSGADKGPGLLKE